MDFVMDLPNSKGKSVIMMVVDRITKYAHFCAPYHHFKSNIVIIAFMEVVQKLHENLNITNIPVSLEISGHFFFSYLNTQLTHSPCYHL